MTDCFGATDEQRLLLDPIAADDFDWEDGLLARPPGYYDDYLFSVVGLAAGVPKQDKRYSLAHPKQSERWRAYLPGETVPEPPGVTDVYVYEATFFDGTRTGWRHRMLLRRSDKRRSKRA
jgi:hypothetical protein